MEIITQNETEGSIIYNNINAGSSFHAGNRGSNPLGDANLQDAKSLLTSNRRLFLCLWWLVYGLAPGIGCPLRSLSFIACGRMYFGNPMNFM